MWYKLLIGSVLGAVLGWFLPSDNQTLMNILMWLFDMGIRIGRYMVMPILIFSLTIAVYELRQDNIFLRLIAHTFLLLFLSTFFVIMIGIFVIYFFPTIRIPILTVEQVIPPSFDPFENIKDIFPSNMLLVLSNDGVYFFPACVLAFLLGMGLSYGRNMAKPIVAITDSLSHIFYHISTYFVDILGIVIIVLSAYWAVQYRNAISEGIFLNIILLLTILSVILAFIVLPFFFYFFGGGKNPWTSLRGSLEIAIPSFFSGDVNFTIPILLHHTKENLKIRRRISAVTVPIFTTFGRAGSAMVAVITLVVVIQSYSSIKLNLVDMLIIGFQGCAMSLLLARYSATGAYIALSVLCLNYSTDFSAGYLIFKPIAFYLIAIGTFLDIMIVSFATNSIARMNEQIKK